MASKGNGDGPVAIEKVEAEDDNGDEQPVPDDDGASGVNEKTGKQVVDESVAGTATDILHTVVTSGTGERAQVGDDYIWGKTGTTDNNADAWFVGANEDITVAVWVGYPDGATPMETEFAGGPVDGGTIPALIWHDVVTSYDTLKASKGADDGTTTDPAAVAPTYDTTVPPATTTTPAPAPVTPTEPAPVTPTPEETPTPPEDTAPPADTGGTSSGTAGGLG
jgi:penicillin-binding protein 1A